MISSTSYVRTADIKTAVQGRESEVLAGLGIHCDTGRTHIDCPYPGHGGADDWRWVEEKKRAFCSCNKSGTADTIFDVVAKCGGLGDDFEAIKLRMAELLGRDDLIRTKGTGGQRQDVGSLLSPPADQRDDGLPRAYLAHRLHLNATDIVMPTTPATGFKALGFFDPPTGAGKPVHVGDYPCSVFGMVGSDGRRHAQRIYVAAGGLGKADLGRNAAGKDRDPKKSARVAEGDSINGRVVVWGDIAAGRNILSEGIETGAAIAYVYRGEVASGAVSVVAGVSAVGVEGFVPHDKVVRVTVAADRDEKAVPSKPMPSRRGERAAREFGMRHHEAVTVDIALPGQRGAKADWLDVLLDDGEAAVRAGIEAAVQFVPTAEEIAAQAEKVGGEGELARIAAECPLPTMYGTRLDYRHFGNEVWAHKEVAVGKGEDRGTLFVPVFTPFGIPARLRYADGAEAYGLRLSVLDMGGRMRALDVERTDLARLGAAEARSMLFGAGLRTMDDGEKIAVECLKAVKPEREIDVVRKPGWHTLAGVEAPVFVCPDGTILGLPAEHYLELSVSAQLSPQAARGGSLQGWKDAVAAASLVAGCPHWLLGTIAAFAGPLIDLTKMDSAGINFSGLSSSGKTTAQRLAASAWSKPATQGDTLFQTAKATVNSLGV